MGRKVGGGGRVEFPAPPRPKVILVEVVGCGSLTRIGITEVSDHCFAICGSDTDWDVWLMESCNTIFLGMLWLYAGENGDEQVYEILRRVLCE